jgi:hypothetical protein
MRPEEGFRPKQAGRILVLRRFFDKRVKFSPSKATFQISKNPDSGKVFYRIPLKPGRNVD